MIKTLGSFAQERVGSLVSKKVAAAAVGSSVVMGLPEGSAQDGVIIISVAYIIGQALVDSARAWQASE